MRWRPFTKSSASSDDGPALIAFLDANVLYGGEVRNFLMRLAMAEAFDPRWTDKVQDEWTSHLAENRPDITPAQLARIRALMQSHVIGAVVEGYEPLIASLFCPLRRPACARCRHHG